MRASRSPRHTSSTQHLQQGRGSSTKRHSDRAAAATMKGGGAGRGAAAGGGAGRTDAPGETAPPPHGSLRPKILYPAVGGSAVRYLVVRHRQTQRLRTPQARSRHRKTLPLGWGLSKSASRQNCVSLRRHLSVGQRAMFAQQWRGEEESAAKERLKESGEKHGKGVAALPHPIEDTGKTRDKLANKVGVGGKAIDKARKVSEQAFQKNVADWAGSFIIGQPARLCDRVCYGKAHSPHGGGGGGGFRGIIATVR